MPGKLLLYKKEWTQNLILYIFPFPFVIILIGLRFSGQLSLIPSQMLPIITISVPLVLAIAYGLQGFDVEENAQTRDFLLVKPLSVWQIIMEKWFAGFGTVLVWTLGFIFGAQPQLWTWPLLTSVSTWVGILLIYAVILTYSSSFLAGIWIKGPKKLLVAGGFSLVTFAVFFITWSSWTTVLWHSSIDPFIASTTFMLTGVSTCILIICVTLLTIVWILRQRPRLQEDKTFLSVLLLLLVFPLFSISFNLFQKPALRVAYFAGMDLFGSDPAFWIEDGLWRPNSSTLAVISSNNALGLTKLGEKPRIIYRGKIGQNQKLADLAWSPNGAHLAFRSGTRLFVWFKGQPHPIDIGEGSSPCWSQDSTSLVFAKSVEIRPLKTINGTFNLHHIELFKADFVKSIAEPYRSLDLESPQWFWDSKQNAFYTLLSDGHWLNISKKQPKVLRLPQFQPNEVIITSRLIPDLKNNRLLISTYSYPKSLLKKNIDFSKVTLRTYIHTLDKAKFILLSESPATKYTNIIPNSDFSQALWGRNGSYQLKPFSQGGAF